jgi:hypothetical protein
MNSAKHKLHADSAFPSHPKFRFTTPCFEEFDWFDLVQIRWDSNGNEKEVGVGKSSLKQTTYQ